MRQNFLQKNRKKNRLIVDMLLSRGYILYNPRVNLPRNVLMFCKSPSLGLTSSSKFLFFFF